MLIGATDTATAVPIGIGAAIGGLASALFVFRAGSSPQPQRRFTARLVSAAYAGVALLCLVAAIALDDVAFIVLTALLALLAIAAVLVSFRRL